MTSVVIAAHNESTVIGRCLEALGHDPDLEIVVAANGCSDDTAAIARKYEGVRVVELAQASKSAALNAGDAAVTTFPRIYLDADIVLPPGSVARLAAALLANGPLATAPNTAAAPHPARPLAAMPARVFDLARRPIPVRAFFTINARLPVYRTALFGRGVIALSEAGRARFDRFPDLSADDLFLDSLFTAQEKQQVDSVVVTVGTPRRTRDLVRRLARVRAGNAAMRAAAPQATSVRAASNTSWLTDVVLPQPWLAPAGVLYAALTIAAQIAARRRTVDWGHTR